MSKRKQTENLHLYAYELTTGLPTFLKDWSDNMAILDSAHSAVLSLINALDTRLTTAEGTLEDLSPESIQDYKIRLDALEKKVVINTNGIKDVNTKLATVNAQINTINAEQIVQNNRLTALETLGASHTELINALRTDLTGVDGRVTTLEQCCENVQHEITDMQHDIDGFNDDVTALGTQVETLSNAVTELTELVNSLQLDVVSQRLDSFEASLTALTDRVTTAENNIVAQGSTLEEHNTRITANENNIENIDTEIGDTDYSEIGNTVSSSLVELADRIRALTPQEYDVLISRLNTVETEVGDIEGAVDNLNNSVSALQTSVANKADESDLILVQGDVTALQTSVANKADASDVTELQSDVSALQTSVANKADSSDLTALSTVVGGSLNVTDPTEGEGVIKFGVDANGNYGYKKVGADSVTPFKSVVDYTNYSDTAIILTQYSTSSLTLNGMLVGGNWTNDFMLSSPLNLSKGKYLFLYLKHGTGIIIKPILSDLDGNILTIETLTKELYTRNTKLVQGITEFNINETVKLTGYNIENTNNVSGYLYSNIDSSTSKIIPVFIIAYR